MEELDFAFALMGRTVILVDFCLIIMHAADFVRAVVCPRVTALFTRNND